MDLKAKYEAKRLATEHSKYTSSLVEKIAHDNFIHGFKHGVEYMLSLKKQDPQEEYQSACRKIVTNLLKGDSSQ